MGQEFRPGTVGRACHCFLLSGAQLEDSKAGGWSHLDKAQSPRSGSWCCLLPGGVAGVVGRTLTDSVVAGFKGQAGILRARKPGGSSIAFCVLTMGVTQPHFCHIFLLKAGIKFYTVSSRGNVDSSLSGETSLSHKKKWLGWNMCCGCLWKTVPQVCHSIYPLRWWWE